MSRRFRQEFMPTVALEYLDFINIDLENDTRLGIDPALVNTRDSELGRLRLNFATIFEDYRQYLWEQIGEGNINEIVRLINVNESPEVGLGYSKTHRGSGIGKRLALKIANQIIDHSTQIIPLNQFSMMSVYIRDMGIDRVSDISVGVLKIDLIEFTQRICRENHIPMSRVLVNNIFRVSNKTWFSDMVDLPINRFDTSRRSNKGIILIPKYFLRGKLSIGYPVLSRILRRKTHIEHIRKIYGIKSTEYVSEEIIRDYALKNPSFVSKFEKEMTKRIKAKTKKGKYKIGNAEN